jgi:AcrR family transcriptional regulator
MARAGRPPGRPPGPGSTSNDVLSAARRLFAERGYRATTVRGIAAAADVTPAMVHHFFGSKQQVLLAAIRMPIDPVQLLASMTDGPRNRFPRRFVTTFVTLWSADDTGPALRTMLRTAIAEEELAAAIRTFAESVLLPTAAKALDVPVARVATAVSILLGMAVGRHLIAIGALAALDDSEVIDRYVPAVRAALFG